MTARSLTLTVCVVLLVAAAAFWAQTGGLSYPSSVFPMAVIISFAVITALTAFQAAIFSKARQRAGVGTLRGYAAFAATIGYALLIPILGMYTSSFIFLIVLLLLQDKGRRQPAVWVRTLITAILVVLAVYVVFTVGLQVTMPKGFLI